MPNDLTDCPPLFCKPITVDHKNEILYFSDFPRLKGVISFRSLQLDADLDMIHDWVNRDYAKRFWQFAENKQKIADTYAAMLQSPHQHSFVGLRNDMPVCQVDLYRVMADELYQFVPYATPDDCGLHFLMAPIEKTVKHLSLTAFCAFHEFYFSFPMAHRMYGEPDKDNSNANKLVRNAGFEFLKAIQLSYKTANLYSLHRVKYKRPSILK